MARLADIDLRLLRVFQAVVEAGGFAAAQSMLDTTTSTISLHMRDLEQRLGFRLCQRGRAGFGLTDRGYLAYEQIKRMLNSLDDQFDNVLSLKKRLTGKIRLGVVDSLVSHLDAPLIEAIRKFNNLENNVEMQLLVDERSELERRVLAHDLQAAISPFVRPVVGLNFHRVLIERHHLYCGIGHPLFGKNNVMSPSALSQFPFVLRSHLGRADEERFNTMNVRASANNMEAMLTLVLTGQYIGLLPDHLAAAWVDQGRLSRIRAPELEHVSHHSLIVARGLDVSTAASTLIPLILAEVNSRALEEEPWPKNLAEAAKEERRSQAQHPARTFRQKAEG